MRLVLRGQVQQSAARPALPRHLADRVLAGDDVAPERVDSARVREETRHADDGDVALAHASGNPAPRAPISLRVAGQHHLRRVRLTPAQLGDEGLAAGQLRDQVDPPLDVRLAQGLRDQAAVPGPPVHGHHAAGPFAVEMIGELVQALVRGAVVGLAGVAEAARQRREEREELQLLGTQRPRAAPWPNVTLVWKTRSNDSAVLSLSRRPRRRPRRGSRRRSVRGARRRPRQSRGQRLLVAHVERRGTRPRPAASNDSRFARIARASGSPARPLDLPRGPRFCGAPGHADERGSQRGASSRPRSSRARPPRA